MNPLHRHKVKSFGYQVKQNLKSRLQLTFRQVSLGTTLESHDPATGVNDNPRPVSSCFHFMRRDHCSLCHDEKL